LEAEGKRLLTAIDAELIDRQRAHFLQAYGPERLASMADADLLRLLPYNQANEQPLDYWLEFRNDASFQNRLFGSIAGGSAAKFGAWQDRRTGQWRAKLRGARTIQNISVQKALQIVQERRHEVLAAVAALQPFTTQAIQDIDPEAVQTTIKTAAPRWHGSAWLHKYLHLVYPERIIWSATSAHLQADLYRLGQPATGTAPYGLDIRILQFWAGIPALAQLPLELRYRITGGLQPRTHWCWLVKDSVCIDQLLADESVALGPAQIGNLAGVFSLLRKTHVRAGIASAFQEAGLEFDATAASDLLCLGHELTSGSLIALFEDAVTVRAIGEINGSYHYAFREERPHRLSVNWLCTEPVSLSKPLAAPPKRIHSLTSSDPRVAELEAALWVNGSFSAFQVTALPGKRNVSLEPAQGLTGQLMTMLERKKQIILYGPPGTGKTYYAQQLALEWIARRNFGCLPAQLSNSQTQRIRHGRDAESPYIALCTFHPMYGYEDFIEGYRPEREGFSLQPGIFRRLVTAANNQPGRSFVLIIDEINRGNIPKIFGELLTLLEPAQRGWLQTWLPLSGDRFSIPPNLYLIGTMNTADRSILVLDTALRRRFGFRELMPQTDLLAEGRIGDVSLANWLQALNQRLVQHLGQDGRNLQIGHAYFLNEGKPVTSLQAIADIIREDIWPLLQEYCYDNPRALAAILAADQGGIYDAKIVDLHYELFEPGQEERLIKALTAIIDSESNPL
jgi:5-methylcytosine-specific restriction protein B